MTLGIGALALAALTMASTSQPAFARSDTGAGAGATAAAPCASGQLCLYGGRNYLGEVETYPAQPVGTCVDLSQQLKGDVSSISNKLDGDVQLFAGDRCAGDSRRFSTGNENPDLGDPRTRFDNLARSVRFLAPPGPCDPRSHNLCLFADADMKGEVQIEAAKPAGTCVDLRPSLKSQISSVSNYLQQDILLFPTDGCSGDPNAAFALDFGIGLFDLSRNQFDNKTRSVKLLAPYVPCQAGQLCLYSDRDMAGDVQTVAPSSGACVDLQQSLKGQVSSVDNRTNRDVALFPTEGCSGNPADALELSAGVGLFDLNNNRFDNKTRSVRFH